VPYFPAGEVRPDVVGPLVGLLPVTAGCGWNMPELGCRLALLPCPPGIGAPGCVCVGPSGTGLLRASTRFEVDDVGVACAELDGDWFEALPRGDAVPEDESFFLASLLPSRSLLRESCSCCQTSSILWRSCAGDSRKDMDSPLAGGSLSSCLATRTTRSGGRWSQLLCCKGTRMPAVLPCCQPGTPTARIARPRLLPYSHTEQRT
jgi:hypothetical protein